MLKYLLILFVVMVALSPLLSMRPSPRQRKIAALRESAALGGLNVMLLDHPEPAPESGPQPFYRRLRRGDDPRLPARTHCALQNGCWTVVQGQPNGTQLALLADLPEGVSALVADAGGVGVFWNEQGETSDVERLGQCLEQWISALPRQGNSTDNRDFS